MALAAVPAKSGVAFDVANRVFFRLYQASNLMHKQGTRHVSKFGRRHSNGPCWRPCATAGRGDGMTVKDLMEFLDVSRQISLSSSTGLKRRTGSSVSRTRMTVAAGAFA